MSPKTDNTRRTTLDFRHSLTPDGNMDYRFGKKDEVYQNRSGFLDTFNIWEGHYIVGKAEHGVGIFTADSPEHHLRGVHGETSAPVCDILVTTKVGLYLAFPAADCPILGIYDPVRSILALCHSGHQGLSKRAPQITVRHLVDNYGSDPANLIVRGGPSLKAQSALYGTKDFTNSDPALWEPFISGKEGEYYADFDGLIKSQLTESGVIPDHVTLSPLNTMGLTLFSHRRRQLARQNGETNIEPDGRFLVLAGMQPIPAS